jgi:hypothetical protein
MVKFFSERIRPQGEKSSHDLKQPRSLSYEGTYLCPICRHGQIAELPLMEAVSCNFCRHIFTVNLSNQTVQVVDSSQPMSWRWDGRTWLAAYQEDQHLAILVWILCLGLVLLPSAIVGIAAYIFPPLPDSPWARFSSVWTLATLILHGVMVAWVLAEYYQVPFYISSKIRLQRLLSALNQG